MIASLRGTLIYTDDSVAIIECAGVGYKCFVSRNTLKTLNKIGSEIFLHTFLAVREDAMDLYGFADVDELNCFKLITSVNGVGYKIGIALLSEFTANQINYYILANDAKSLTAASGVGIKLAQRIILELKDKATDSDLTASKSKTNDVSAISETKEAIEALVALGYPRGAASLAVGKLDASLPASELIKQALKTLARRV